MCHKPLPSVQDILFIHKYPINFRQLALPKTCFLNSRPRACATIDGMGGAGLEKGLRVRNP
jgi:hypothetical protein